MFFFMPQNRLMPEKCGKTVKTISHGRCIFTPIQRGGEGWQRGWGENNKTGRKSVHDKFSDCWPHRPLSTFCLKEKMEHLLKSVNK